MSITYKYKIVNFFYHGKLVRNVSETIAKPEILLDMCVIIV
jgi:hypothetical protein